MARRPRSDDPVAAGVRGALIDKLAGHVRLTVDPRCMLDPDWVKPAGYVYVDRKADLLDDLRAGKVVDVAPGLLRGIAEVPAGCYLVRVDVDGSISPAPYERLR